MGVVRNGSRGEGFRGRMGGFGFDGSVWLAREEFFLA